MHKTTRDKLLKSAIYNGSLYTYIIMVYIMNLYEFVRKNNCFASLRQNI